ncbi:MAG: hypothetical protein MPJ78_12515 [Hyphomicrobiaceae bacterium]|nr:hypothetical protein [Hyphomicrobiaceae bacterium]
MPHRGDDSGRPGSDRIAGPSGEIYIEYKQVGQAMKVIAVDAATGTEVTIMGPASAAQTDLQRIAVRKLQAQLEKDSGEGGSDPGEEPGEDGSSGSKGWIA